MQLARPPVGWLRSRAAMLGAALLATVVLVAIAPTKPAEAIGGERAAILFPFDNGGKTWISGHGPSSHPVYFSGYGYSMDLHAANGTAVKARFQSADGAISLKVLAAYELNCTPSAGKYVELEVKVDGVFAGKVIYEHLNNVQVSINQTISVGTTLGYLNAWSQSSCWADTLSDGVVHTHMEAQKTCYRNLPAWTNYDGGTPVGLLSSAYPATYQSRTVCDENDVNAVMAADSDGDGVIDVQDLCPNQSGPPSSAGCPLPPANNSPGSSYLKADFNGDGKTDVATTIGPNESDFWVWLSTGTGLSAPTRWWNGAGNGVQWTKIKPFAMDFNADGKTDIGALHEVGASWTMMWAWISTGSSFITPTTPVWNSGAGNFNLATSTPVVGDFNGDSKPDVVAATDNGAGSTDLWLWPSSGSTLGAPVRWWNGAGNGVVWSKIKLFAYDSNTDGKADIGAFQDAGGSRTLIWAWLSTGSAFTTPTVPLWDSGAGNYNTATATPVVADFDGDGKVDVSAINGLASGGSSDIWVWLSTGTGLATPVRWWNGAGNGVAWSKVKPFAGDFTGDGKADFGAFHDVGTFWTKVWIWNSTGSSFVTPTIPAWDFGSGNYNAATSTPVS